MFTIQACFSPSRGSWYASDGLRMMLSTRGEGAIILIPSNGCYRYDRQRHGSALRKNSALTRISVPLVCRPVENPKRGMGQQPWGCLGCTAALL